MMIVITGSTGRLGHHLAEQFPEAIKPSHAELDVTDRKSVFDFFSKNKPDIVIHGAAWVDVRGCESDKEKAWKVNVQGTENVVEAVFAANPNCYFVYPSTACVFHGDRGDYTEDDTPDPINFYGVTKLVAEQLVKRFPNHLIARTDFVDRAKWRYEGAFVDRFSTSVFADTLAKAFRKVVDDKVKGIIHLTGKRKISHYDLAKITTPEVKPIKLADIDIPLPKDQSLKSVKGWNILELEY
jgi:dTDP-4-dehydrorhamnose reductase